MSKHTIICPSCKQLMSRVTLRCPNCGWNNNTLNKITSKIGAKNISLLIIGANIAIYFASLIMSLIFADTTILERLAFFSPNSSILNLMGWADPYKTLYGSYWQLLSSIFLHGGIFHIAFNMIWIYMLYPQNEAIIGKQQTFIIYVLSGLSGSLAATVFGSAPVVGASGAILGIMGSLIAAGRNSYNIKARLVSRKYVPVMIILLVAGFIMPGISNLAHLGGGAFGYLAGRLISKRKLSDRILNLLTFTCSGFLLITLFFMVKNILSVLFF